MGRWLGTVFHLEWDDLTTDLGHQINLSMLFATPVGEADVLRVVPRKQVFENSSFSGNSECSRVFKDALALEHDSGCDSSIRKVYFEAGAQHILAVTQWRKTINEVRGLQQFDEILRRGPLYLQIAAKVDHVEQAAGMADPVNAMRRCLLKST